jgi:thiosulfate reductase cytochrome b subunit
MTGLQLVWISNIVGLVALPVDFHSLIHFILKTKTLLFIDIHLLYFALLRGPFRAELIYDHLQLFHGCRFVG